MHRDEFRRIVNESVRESLTGQGFDYRGLPQEELTQLTTAIADGVFAGLENLVDDPTLYANATLAQAAAAATAAATAAASIAQDTRGALAAYPAAGGASAAATAGGPPDLAEQAVPAPPRVGPFPSEAVRQGVYAGRVPDATTMEETLIWRGRPYLTLGTVYELTSQRLRVIRGIASNAIDEVELVRVRDTKVKQSAAERLFRIGDITIASDDAMTPQLMLVNVTNPVDVREAIRKAVYEERERRKLLYREELDGGDMGGDVAGEADFS
jgi:hypothetical protein